MGSLENAKIVGFVCRLCAKLNEYVVHLYSEKNRRLIRIVKEFLSIDIREDDGLPKTVCVNCVKTLERHYSFIQETLKHNQMIEQMPTHRLGKRPAPT